MKKAFKKLTALLLSCTLIFSCSGAFAEEERNKNIVANTLIDAVIRNVMENYKFEADETELYRHALREVIAYDPGLTELALEGIYNNLDVYSSYFTAEEFQSLMEDINGEFCGIGVTIIELEGGLLVTDVQRGSAAEGAGIKQGDIIISANGIDIRGMDIDIARTHIVGAEGTPITVGVIRDGVEHSFDMLRSSVSSIVGFYQILEGNIGFISLASFDKNAPEFMAEALEALKDTENIIIDLRSNLGGTLESLQTIAGYTLPHGPVMHLEYKQSENDTSVENALDGFRHKLVVLVDEYTASAAEAYAAAVQDYGVGVVVGEQTMGKGTMQIVNGLITGGGYKLTVAEYLSPLKRKINNIGVEPDYKVKPQIVTYSDYYFDKITYDRVLSKGDTGEDVLALEQRLHALGYNVCIPDKVYDDNTYYAVKAFQESAGLYPYGVLDITTQISLHNHMQTKKILLDKVLEKAIELALGDLESHIEEAKSERVIAE